MLKRRRFYLFAGALALAFALLAWWVFGSSQKPAVVATFLGYTNVLVPVPEEDGSAGRRMASIPVAHIGVTNVSAAAVDSLSACALMHQGTGRGVMGVDESLWLPLNKPQLGSLPAGGSGVLQVVIHPHQINWSISVCYGRMAWRARLLRAVAGPPDYGSPGWLKQFSTVSLAESVSLGPVTNRPAREMSEVPSSPPAVR